MIESAEMRPRGTARKSARGKKRPVLFIVATIVVLILGFAMWIGVRALLARDELESAIPLAQSMQKEVIAGNGAAVAQIGKELGKKADSAASLTSDPVWRAFEIVPALGHNLTVMRQLAAVVDGLAKDAVTPLSDVAGKVKTSDFRPIDGALNLQPLITAQPAVSAASSAVRAAREQVEDIDTTGTLDELANAADRLRVAVVEAESSISAVDKAVQIIPAILGADGARNYLVLFQNPAELRATGGIAGAVALLHTEDGKIELMQQLSSGDIDSYIAPVIELPTDTRGLYGDITARYMQDVNLTPNFSLSGEIASEMWRRQFGQDLDGVLSIDPVALGYLLQATGPVTLPTGDQLTSDNATQLLLTDVYSRYSNPDDQDVFFAAAAGSVFAAVASGDADPVALIKALSRAAGENRVLVWSADAAEQAILADTTLAGGLPVSNTEAQRFGVYLNDATGSKMGTYLDLQTSVGQATCRNDQRPTYAVDVVLKNTAPGDAATSLPSYVTADGTFGVAPGNIKYILSVYGPPEMSNLGLARDGKEVGYHPAADATYPVSSISIELAPGETTTVRFNWLGEAPFGGALELQTTPVIHSNETQKLEIAC